MMLERVCRVGAIAIAVVAVVDPVWVVARSATPRVVVQQAPGATTADLVLVSDTLAGDFVVETEATPDTAVRVVVGHHAPLLPSGHLTFVVVPDAVPDVPEIRGLQLGDRMSINAVGRVRVDVALPAESPAPLQVSLLADGVPVDTQTVTVEPGATRATADLLFVPSRVGLSRLRVAARFGNGPEVIVDAATEVVDRTLRVLSYEARPSWAATFVRRALEEDPRFEVVVRSLTSRGVAIEAGEPPSTLARADELAQFDVVLVSSLDAIDDRAAVALEAYLRGREGAVVLLPEAEATLLSRLTGVSSWTDERRPELERVNTAFGPWTASEFLWPDAWPAGAEAATDCLVAAGTARRCPVWRLPVGGGRVVVSSAVDGWRTRTAEASAFAAFWRSLVGGEATMTPQPVDVFLRSRLVEAGSRVAGDVQVLAGTGSLSAELQSTDGGVQSVRLWPSDQGHFRAEFRAPDTPGRYRLRVTRAGSASSASAEFVVVDQGAATGTVQRPRPESRALLEALAASRGGEAIAMADLGTLSTRIADTVGAAPVDTTTRLMRSPWWIVPFAGLLALEWWTRRRRGAR